MTKKTLKPNTIRTLIIILALAAAAVLQQQGGPNSGQPPFAPLPTPSQPEASSKPGTAATEEQASGAEQIAAAYAARQSDLWVEASAQIERILPDDQQGSRHQRLIVRLANGHTLLIAHNIDLAPRIPRPETGQWVKFRGEYEWNDQGGVVHWTHHDPAGRLTGGWLEYAGQRYQ